MISSDGYGDRIKRTPSFNYQHGLGPETASMDGRTFPSGAGTDSLVLLHAAVEPADAPISFHPLTGIPISSFGHAVGYDQLINMTRAVKLSCTSSCASAAQACQLLAPDFWLDALFYTTDAVELSRRGCGKSTHRCRGHRAYLFQRYHLMIGHQASTASRREIACACKALTFACSTAELDRSWGFLTPNVYRRVILTVKRNPHS
ncbi:hypothetical protein QBC45DRAFT_202275 [Copromyces sp. CBS 386.78]|nr:hypothetical protein QBC45DRAFT_202275 [Copromyces sp. CBS 386.78]